MARRLLLAYRLFGRQLLAYRLLRGDSWRTVYQAEKITIFGVFWGCGTKLGVYRRWRLILLYRYFAKVWPTALGTDEGGCANLALKQGSKTAKIYRAGDPWTQNVGRTTPSKCVGLGLGGGGWADWPMPPYPCCAWGRGMPRP